MTDLDRRLFLKTSAGTAAVLCIGAMTPWALKSARADITESSDPWHPWTQEALQEHSDPRLRAIAHAILAPNPQNLQPWLCEFPREDRIVLRNGGERRLAVSDIPDRQLTVGFGTFSEVLVLALEAEGYDVDIDLFPEGEPWPQLDNRPVAVFTLTKAAPKKNPLLAHLLKRHTNRTPFDTQKIPTAEQLENIRATARLPERVHFHQDDALAAKIQDITLRAWDKSIIDFAPTREEVAKWTKIGTKAITALPYGPAMPDAVVQNATGPVTRETLSDPQSAIIQANRENYRKAVGTGLRHIWVSAPAFDRKGMFEAGRDWVRLHLQATALGLNMQPHSQALQDFAEIEPFVAELHDDLGIAAPGRIHMLGRVGYGAAIGPSPRATALSHLTKREQG